MEYGAISELDKRFEMENHFEWELWTDATPYLDFPAEWEIKVIPPFGGAVVRFWIRHKKIEGSHVSVYLDCYGLLGAVKEPYWEVYPYRGDVGRVFLGEEDKLLEEIAESFREQSRNGGDNHGY